MSKKAISITEEIIEINAKTTLSLILVGGALITGVWDSIKSNCAQKRLQSELKRLTRSERIHRLCTCAGILETFLKEPTTPDR